MKLMKNGSLLCVLIVLGSLAQNAMALSYSSYGYENKWQGYKNYNKDGIDMTLYFNVYDTVANPAEFTWNGATAKPGTDRYIYAYQIINKSGSEDIGLFSLLNKSGNPLAQQLMHSTTTQWDGSVLSVAPDPKVSGEQGIWQWSADGGFLTAGKNSWYLIFSSNNAPVKGSFKVETASETEPPTPDVPEPCTLALFGAASALFAAKRSRKRRPG
ncbi:MAG: PEP-CTERM sorting domain-containing protein [Sedimentisphaerales bacterium]|jgi:hypothetical protein